MHSHADARSARGARAYLWGALAVLTCSCHLPVLAVVLAGTSVGALLGQYWGIAAVAVTALFVISLVFALRAFQEHT